MSRVAQLDSTALDQELHSLFRTELSQNLDIHKNEEEWHFVLDTLVFFFGSKFFQKAHQTKTYGSELSGVTYNCKRRTLYIVAILSSYLGSKISKKVYSTTDGTVWSRLKPLYVYLSHFYSAADLVNFACFLLSTGQSDFKYLTPIHRLLGASSSTDTYNPVSFYHNTVYAGIEFQNRQLLWNAILEFFNATLLNNARWLNGRRQRPSTTKMSAQLPEICARCQELPTNPFQIQCCQANYCYVCVIRAIDSKCCDNCSSSTNLRAEPIY
ncbi:hypothetical protein HG536_0B01400 [Torulaspora globosa]|uniref:RING-type E3 ubiquitin transferase (cysteine targeting) n=1 Tax=Torulaspora globosa TaxID=48254 RepID=A0A7G3ZCP2_9SACH|nr:uncharacterized protein HG536_0B01400 [Torulaspora globosa]QLL31278.1 hypothetical protein HG536_0B01400 [Torulaspora globosa]